MAKDKARKFSLTMLMGVLTAVPVIALTAYLISAAANTPPAGASNRPESNHAAPVDFPRPAETASPEQARPKQPDLQQQIHHSRKLVAQSQTAVEKAASTLAWKREEYISRKKEYEKTNEVFKDFIDDWNVLPSKSLKPEQVEAFKKQHPECELSKIVTTAGNKETTTWTIVRFKGRDVTKAIYAADAFHARLLKRHAELKVLGAKRTSEKRRLDERAVVLKFLEAKLRGGSHKTIWPSGPTPNNLRHDRIGVMATRHE